jgi:hypothetical protein
MEDMDDTSPSADIPQAEAWPGFNAGMPAPPGVP